MTQVAFSYIDDDSVTIGGTFVCNRVVTRTIHLQPYTFYLCNTGQRTIIRYERGDHAYGEIEVNGIVYYTDTTGVLYYDITDELRASTTFVFLGEPAIRLEPIPGIDVELLPLPGSPLAEGETGVQIMTPSVIYQMPRLGLNYPLLLEIDGTLALEADWQVLLSDEENVMVHDGVADRDVRQMELPNVNDDAQVYATRLACSDANIPPLVMLDDCEQACVLRWLSASGVYKQLIWRVKKITQSVEAQDLMPRGDNYKQRKGYNVSLTAYIEGLDAYSYAYYADIITSPDVHCAMLVGENLQDEATRVAISSGSYVVPDGNAGELQTLEIEVELKHYDVI